ncbi:uncharacterized protein LOC144156155 [Haemaphysalis longicornis]
MAPFNQQLVREVKKYRHLWDQHTRLFTEAACRDAAWTDIAATLGVSVKQCQTRWRSLRDTYVKRKKRLNATADSPWDDLEQELRFIDDYLRPPKRCGQRPAATMPGPGSEESPEAAAAYPPVVPVPAAEQDEFVLPHAPPVVVQVPPSDLEREFCRPD